MKRPQGLFHYKNKENFMEINTLIIGYVPQADLVGKKPKELRDESYFKGLLAEFDLGELHFTDHSGWKEKVDRTNPLFIVSFAGEGFAEEIRQYKHDALLYVAYSPANVFHRKAETDEKKEKNIRIFSEIERLVQKIREGGEKELLAARRFAAMSYDDLYKMLVQAIIGEDENLRKGAWKLLTDNSGHKNFLWMRGQLLCEVWNNADGKGKEEFLCLAMDQHIENGFARKMDDFVENEQRFHQYMLCGFSGEDLNYIRRIPYGFKKQDKWAYQELLDKYETPNGLAMMFEVGQCKTRKEEFLKNVSA